MAQELTIPGGEHKIALPSYLQAAYAEQETNIVTGERGAQLTVKGKVFTIHAEGETTQLMRRDPDTGDESPVSNLPVIVLDYGVKMGRSFYEGAYNPDEIRSPTCWSLDSVTPEAEVEEKQSDKCASCPMAVKGSAVSENNKAVAACSQHRVLVVVPVKRMDLPPMRLRIAQTSNYDGRSPEAKQKGNFAFQNFLDHLKVRGITNTKQIVVGLSFDINAAYPKLFFKAVRYVTEEEHAQIEAIMATGKVEEILLDTGTAVVKHGGVLPKTERAPVAGKPTAEQKKTTRDALIGEVEKEMQARATKAVADTAKSPTGGIIAAVATGAPVQGADEDDDDFAIRVLQHRKAVKKAEAEAAEKAKAEAAKPKAAAEFKFRPMAAGEDEDDYNIEKATARKAWNRDQAAAIAAPAKVPEFVAPARQDGEDDDDYEVRVITARKAYKAKHGVPAAPTTFTSTAPAAPAVAPVVEATEEDEEKRLEAQLAAARARKAGGAAPAEPAKRTRRTKEQIAADNAAAEAAKAKPAEVVAEPVPAGEEKPEEKFLPGAIGDLSGDDGDDAGMPPPPSGATSQAKAGGPKMIEAAKVAVPDDVAKMLDSWDD